ncbi:MAG: NAD(P)/FAD-dependent oxidoreductase [Acidimicrobiales bacterium]
MSRSSDSAFDAVVVGAGPAGLNAALVLGRTRRRVLVLDAAEPRNAASHALHGFLSRDGLDPAELRRIGRIQLESYPHVSLVSDAVESVRAMGDRFEVTTSGGDSILARKLLLAVGIKDDLPKIDGFASLFGNSAFHCPYCDAWEVRDQPMAVFSEGSDGFRLALLLLSWSRDIVLCTHGPSKLGPDEIAHLASAGVLLREQRVARLEGEGGQLVRMAFEDGTSLMRRALFFHGPVRLASRLPETLGCTLTEAGRIEVDEAGRTSVPGVYAAGDAARRQGQHPATQVSLAAASGALAAIALHQELMHEDVGLTPALPR